MAVKRCPLCRTLSDERSEGCGCGYTFGQDIGTTIQLLDEQIRKGKNFAIGGGACIALGVAGTVALVVTGGAVWFGFIPAIFGMVYFPRGFRLLRGASESKQELERMRQLPAARLVLR